MKNGCIKSCVGPEGTFLWGIHKPDYEVKNLRKNKEIATLGHGEDGQPVENQVNFPCGDLAFHKAQPIVEVPNPFPFWGSTYILTAPADRFAAGTARFSFSNRKEEPEDVLEMIASGALCDPDGKPLDMGCLPRPVRLAAAQTSKSKRVLTALAKLACSLELDHKGKAVGIRFKKTRDGAQRPLIFDHELFEILGNNPALPYDYKLAMVLRPGIQGTSPIVGEFCSNGDTHVWEYLRANSYIPWGHYASNMAHDCVRYKASQLNWEDMKGLRHLYYQRIYIQMALSLGLEPGIELDEASCSLTPDQLEKTRSLVLEKMLELIEQDIEIPYTSTLWGWNYGFDFAPSGYRLHASHQQVHNQFALIRPLVASNHGIKIPSYAMGDMVADFCFQYDSAHCVPFFAAYLDAIRNNVRIDGRAEAPCSLVIWEDENVLLFVPKAQRSQGEIQIMTKGNIGNIMEADTGTRRSLDMAILLAVRTLDNMGAEMVTCGELSKRFDNPDTDQRLIYFFLPRHADSPGAFSERQERWITGHYPEDFAEAARSCMPSI